MYSADEKRQSCKNSKNSAASAQNDDFYCKNGCLHYFFSPILFRLLLDTTLQWGFLPLVSFCHWSFDNSGWSSWWLDDFRWFWMVKFEISNKNLITKVGRFWSTMGKPSFLLLWTQSSIFFHSKAACLLEYIKEDYTEKELLEKSQIWWRNCCDRVRSRHGRKIPEPS